MNYLNLKGDMNFTGRVHIQLFDENMNLVEERLGPNTVVTVGKQYLATWLAAASQATKFMSYVGLGTGITSPTASDTDLQTPLASRVQGELASSSNLLVNTSAFGPGVDTGTITEAGLFSDSTSGTMFARQTFSAVVKGSSNTLVVTWTVSIL